MATANLTDAQLTLVSARHPCTSREICRSSGSGDKVKNSFANPSPDDQEIHVWTSETDSGGTMICEQKGHSWRILSYLLVLLVAGLAPLYVHAQTPQRLLQSDFTYVGDFKLPGGKIGQDTFEYSSGFVAGNVYNDPIHGKSIFITGYLSAGYVSQTLTVAQIKIPPSLSGFPTATVIQGFSSPSNGIASQALGSSGNGFGSLVVYNGKLIGTQSSAYDATCSQTKSAWVSSLNFSQPAASGPYSFSSSIHTAHHWRRVHDPHTSGMAISARR